MKARYFFPAVAIFSVCCSLCLVSAGAQQQKQTPEIIISQRMAESLALTKVAPEYSDAAMSKEIAGQTVVAFTIGRDGSVADVRTIENAFFGCWSINSNDPEIRHAAIAAVKQWKFRPFVTHQQPGDAGEPVEVGAAVALTFDFRKPIDVAALGAPAGMAPCNPREGAATITEFVQPKADPNRPVFGAPVIEPSRAEEMLAHKVEARYPQMAKIAHIQGNVIVQVLIDKQGHVAGTKPISGHPILIQAALDAVKQWEFKPFLLNGEPAQVETAVVVKFRMQD